jgi:hypothetical protein
VKAAQPQNQNQSRTIIIRRKKTDLAGLNIGEMLEEKT